MGKIDFPVYKGYGTEKIKKVQETLLIMAKEIDSVFNRREIDYFITFGTLLGAVRHGGFIPWDDDFDIFLFDENYDKAICYLEKELPSWMVVHNEYSDPIYWPNWTKIRDKNSEIRSLMYTDDNKYKYKGINIDIYRLKKTLHKDVDRYIYRENIQYFKRKYLVGLIDRKLYYKKTLQIYPKYFKEVIKSYCSRDKKKCYSFITDIKAISKESIFPLKKYDFEGEVFWGPNDAKEILTKTYGDYMQIPEYKDRRTHASSVKFFDMEKEK